MQDLKIKGFIMYTVLLMGWQILQNRNKSTRAKTATEVINEKSQFSGLWGRELNKAFKGKQGNIMALDTRVINADVINFTREYVKRHTQGINNSVGGSTHYANPKASSASSRRMWVDKVASRGHYAGFKNKGIGINASFGVPVKIGRAHV